MSEKSNGAAMGGEGSGKAGEGRDGGGRFTAGNKGGPGNPFARQTAAMRRVIHNAVTAEQVEAIVGVMVDKALKGDVAAARLLLSYLAGRPGPTPDPDTLDAHDLAVRRENTATMDDVKAVFETLPAGTLCAVAAAAAPLAHARHRQTLLAGLRLQGQRDEDRRQRQDAPRPRPGRKADRPAPPVRPGAAGTAAPSVAELLRSLPRHLLEPLTVPDVNRCRLVPDADCKRDNPTGPEMTTAAQAGRRPKT